ncbi:hypothetical protein C0Q70_08634 [Pomacea canaliculata]|uniref:Uncharacterized protein n=1 Tax=Pomacea canaliculata TaxID=400727 RepID=A0A2T7P7K8_POMCA|nr:hypothetical protein C0Q70_08634 [Pomacea canaliculata]
MPRTSFSLTFSVTCRSSVQTEITCTLFPERRKDFRRKELSQNVGLGSLEPQLCTLSPPRRPSLTAGQVPCLPQVCSCEEDDYKIWQRHQQQLKDELNLGVRHEASPTVCHCLTFVARYVSRLLVVLEDAGG